MTSDMQDTTEEQEPSAVQPRHMVGWALTVVLAAAAVVGVLVVGGLLLLPFEEKSAHFDSYADAAQSGLVQQGWIPVYLPKGMFDIDHRRDMDHSQSLVRFCLSEGDMKAFAKRDVWALGFKPVDDVDESYIQRAEAWLPYDSEDIPDLDDGGYQFFGEKTFQVSGPVLLALHEESGIVYHWVR